MADKYDVLVIGSGPGGHGAAIQAAKLGKRVAIIERRAAIGGTSVNVGTIPSKTLREAVLYLTGFRQRHIYGISYKVKEDITFQDLMLRCDQVVRNEIGVLRNQFSRNHVTLLRGRASFLAPHLLSIESRSGTLEVEADFIFIATGSVPARSEKVPINGRSIIDIDGVHHMASIPDTLVVVGAGAVGIEYASIFATLGIEVTLVDMRRQILEFLDTEVRQALLYHMREQGVIFRLGEEVLRVSSDGRQVTAYTKSNKRLTGEVLLYAIGRNGATQGLGLDRIGLQPNARGRLQVNEHYQTAIPHIYAVGDVVGFPALASTSMAQGRIAARHALGVDDEATTPLLPYGLYTIPEISMVGQTEEELTQAGTPYEVGLARYRETARGQIIGDRSGTLKLLVHSETRKLLGVHIIGQGAAELVHIGQLAMALGGTLDFLVNNVFNYPTLAECYRIAALDAFNKLA
ncbi:MAG: Si-specific NAD(P)(+) transhydrogenase [Dehalococcoidia bacterium]